MPRTARLAPGGIIYHVCNRAVARLTLFEKPADYQAFEQVLLEAHRRLPLPILAYCIMPNHFHFVTWPRRDGELSEFFRWLTHTHAMRWHAHHGTVGTGHLYQGRFKSFPAQDDDHLLTLCRYVERNALRANLVRRAELWRYSSLWRRCNPLALDGPALCDWPIPRPRNWVAHVNRAETPAELEALRRCVRKGRPFGSDAWVGRIVRRMRLEHTLRDPGRPTSPPPT